MAYPSGHAAWPLALVLLSLGLDPQTLFLRDDSSIYPVLVVFFKKKRRKIGKKKRSNPTNSTRLWLPVKGHPMLMQLLLRYKYTVWHVISKGAI